MKSLWFESLLLQGGWETSVRLTYDGGVITDIALGAAPGDAEERHKIGLPGLCNVHSHAFQRGMAGLAERRGPADDDFWTWREIMYRFLDRMTPEDVQAITAVAYVEMLEAGFTRVGEFHYVHHQPDGRPYDNLAEMAEQIAAAADATGIGLTLLPVLYAHSDFGGAAPTAGQRRFINDPDRYAALHEASIRAVAGLEGARVGAAPHSLRAVTPSELAQVLALARSGPIHIHASEQTREVDACLAWCGQRPVEWLLDHADVDARWCLIHATHLAPSEVSGLSASGAVAGLCPVTEANLGDGIFPTHDYLLAGGALGVGTDSNILIDAAGELRALEYAQRLGRRQRNLLADAEGASVGRTLMGRAQRGGAQALAEPGPALTIGASADFISLTADHPALIGRQGDAWLDAWIFAGGPGVVDSVWRRGDKLVAQGRHRRRDAFLAPYRQRLPRLLA